ncbi:hypothetical protein [Nitrospira sp. Nam74]
MCRPYWAQTKGKGESGAKYVKRNCLPGRTFVDLVDFQTPLDEWNATIADCRLHGTTHELPIARFARERGQLVLLAGPTQLSPGGARLAHRGRGLSRERGHEPLLGALSPHRPAGRSPAAGRHGAHLPPRSGGRDAPGVVRHLSSASCPATAPATSHGRAPSAARL